MIFGKEKNKKKKGKRRKRYLNLLGRQNIYLFPFFFFAFYLFAFFAFFPPPSVFFFCFFFGWDNKVFFSFWAGGEIILYIFFIFYFYKLATQKIGKKIKNLLGEVKTQSQSQVGMYHILVLVRQYVSYRTIHKVIQKEKVTNPFIK